jgi:hypothetical protein
VSIDHARWLVVACGIVTLAATRTDLYVPLPAGVPQELVIACLLVLPVGFGLAVGTWWAAFAALGLVVLPGVRTDSFHLLFLTVEVVILAVLIATGVVIGRLLPRSRVFALPLALLGLLPLAVGAYRTIEPYDHVPARPIIVDARLGRMGSVRLGDEQLRERRDLDGAFTAHAAEGRVTVVTSGNRRVQTGRGVGNGDNLALVEQRHPSARCVVTPPAGEWGKTRYCVLRVGKVEVQFFDDPIRSVTVQRPSS